MSAPHPTPVYRAIPRFDGYALAGSDGSILAGHHVRADTLFPRWRRLRTNPGSHGYPTVVIRGRRYIVHVLMLEAFVGPRPAGYYACHNNGDPHDNSIENLRWDTPRANQADRVLHGTDVRGSKNSRSKLDETQVIEIKRRLAARKGSVKGTARRLAAEFGVSLALIENIFYGHAWAWLHIPEPDPLGRSSAFD